MTTEKLLSKITADFIGYFGYEPTSVRIEDGYAYADDFYCKIINNKTIKKIHGVAWRYN